MLAIIAQRQHEETDALIGIGGLTCPLSKSMDFPVVRSKTTVFFTDVHPQNLVFYGILMYFRGFDPSPVRFTAHLRVKHYFPYSNCHQWVFPTKACRQRVAVSLAKFTELITKVSGLLGCERSSSELRRFFLGK
jgi:hypothetical protein